MGADKATKKRLQSRAVACWAQPRTAVPNRSAQPSQRTLSRKSKKKGPRARRCTHPCIHSHWDPPEPRQGATALGTQASDLTANRVTSKRRGNVFQSHSRPDAAAFSVSLVGEMGR